MDDEFQGQDWERQRLADPELTRRFFDPVEPTDRPHLVIVRDGAGVSKVLRFDDREFAGMIAKKEREHVEFIERQTVVQQIVTETGKPFGLEVIEITDTELSREIGELVHQTLARRGVSAR